MADPKPAERKPANRNSAGLKTAADQSVATYKQLLREYIDRRPSGTRQRIAKALGTHKSFVSQITNPALRVPLPAPHVASIFKIAGSMGAALRTAISSFRGQKSQGEVARTEQGITGRALALILFGSMLLSSIVYYVMTGNAVTTTITTVLMFVLAFFLRSGNAFCKLGRCSMSYI